MSCDLSRIRQKSAEYLPNNVPPKIRRKKIRWAENPPKHWASRPLMQPAANKKIPQLHPSTFSLVYLVPESYCNTATTSSNPNLSLSSLHVTLSDNLTSHILWMCTNGWSFKLCLLPFPLVVQLFLYLRFFSDPAHSLLVHAVYEILWWCRWPWTAFFTNFSHRRPTSAVALLSWTSDRSVVFLF